jgi:hypothetical protein
MDSQVAHRNNPIRLRYSNSRLSRLRVLAMMRRNKTTRVWWEVLPSDARWYSCQIWPERNGKMDSRVEINNRSTRILGYPMERIKILYLPLTFHPMKNYEFSRWEHEANGHTIVASTHHIHTIRGRAHDIIMENAIRENWALLDEMEPWQNYWAYPMWYELPINSLK